MAKNKGKQKRNLQRKIEGIGNKNKARRNRDHRHGTPDGDSPTDFTKPGPLSNPNSGYGRESGSRRHSITDTGHKPAEEAKYSINKNPFNSVDRIKPWHMLRDLEQFLGHSHGEVKIKLREGGFSLREGEGPEAYALMTSRNTGENSWVEVDMFFSRTSSANTINEQTKFKMSQRDFDDYVYMQDNPISTRVINAYRTCLQ